jgi:hypothetical protein
MRGRDLILNNLGWKLLALVLATLIWATYSSDLMDRLRPGSLRRFSAVPVTVLTTAAGGRSYQVTPEKIEVVLRGPASLLAALQPGEVRAYVDLTGVRDTEGLRLKIEVNAPPGFTVARVVPPDAYVEVASLKPESPSTLNSP